MGKVFVAVVKLKAKLKWGEKKLNSNIEQLKQFQLL